MAFTRSQLEGILAEDQARRSIVDTSGQSEALRTQLIRGKKLGGFQRLISGLSAFETGNAAYRTMKRSGNRPGLDKDDIREFLKQYISDVGKGVKIAATGKDEEGHLASKKTYKDVMKEKGYQDKTGNKNWLKNIDATDILGFVGDVALDPSTYITAGTASGAKISTKEGAKTLSKQGGKILAGLSDNLGADVAEKYIMRIARKHPELTKELFDEGGIRFMGKTVVPGSKLPKGIAEKGLVTGTASDLLDLGEKIPGVKKVVTPARETIGEAFNVGYKLKGTPYEGITDKLSAFTKGTNREIESQVTDFLDSAKDIVKKHHKEYGGVAGLGKAITQYVEEKAPLNDEVAKWVDDKLIPTLKQMGETEQEKGILKNWLDVYLPRDTSMEYNKRQARKAVGVRTAGKIDPTISADKARDFGKKFVADDGTEVIGQLPGRALKETDLAKPLKKEMGKLKGQLRDTKKAGDTALFEDTKQKLLSIQERLDNEIIGDDGKIYRQQGVGTQSQVDEWARAEGIIGEGESVFNPNVFETVPRRMGESIRAQKSQELLDWVGKEYGVDLGKPQKVVKTNKAGKLVEEYVPTGMPKDYDTLGIKGLEGKAFPKEIANHLKETHAFLTKDDATAKILKQFDQLQTLWKLSVTSVFPAFHARNFTGGVFNNWLAGIKNPKRYGQAALVMKTMQDGESRIITLGGKKYTTDQILKMFKDQGVGGVTGMMDIVKQASDRYAGGKLAKVKRVAQTYPMGAAEQVENFLRLPLFMDGLAKGETAEKAAQRVFKFHFDYSAESLTKFEKGVKRVIPFYTWTRRNIPLQLEQLGKQPGKYAAIGKLMQGSDREAYWNEQATNPEYLQNETAFRLPNGKYATVGLPMSDLGGIFDAKEWAGKVTPFIKGPVEAVTNYDTFRGKPITDEMDSPEEAAEKKAEWRTRLLAGRFGSTARDVKEIFTNEKGARWDKVSKVVFGINPVDVKKQAPYNFRDMLLEQLPKEVKMVWQSAHIPYEDQYPLLASTRKATAYLDYPELFLVDQTIKQFNKEKQGYDYDPIYNLPWEKAKLLYAQTAKGDKWNSKALKELPWFNEFSKVRSAYFEGANKKDSDYKIESAEYSQKPSAHVAAKMFVNDFDDPAVQMWLEKNKELENQKRIEMGLVTPNMYNKIHDDIAAGAEMAGKNKQKLKYMQAIRMAGLDFYDKFFAEHPELDPTKGRPTKGLR